MKTVRASSEASNSRGGTSPEQRPSQELPMINSAFLTFNLLVCADGFKPILQSTDGDLSQTFLAASDFCRCKASKIARSVRRSR